MICVLDENVTIFWVMIPSFIDFQPFTNANIFPTTPTPSSRYPTFIYDSLPKWGQLGLCWGQLRVK
jgi:hypothetical protein